MIYGIPNTKNPVKIFKLQAIKRTLPHSIKLTQKGDSFCLRFKCTSKNQPSFNTKFFSTIISSINSAMPDNFAGLLDYLSYLKLSKRSKFVSSAAKIEKNLKKDLGVFATLADNTHAAKHIGVAMETAAQKGCKLPRELHLIDFSSLLGEGPFDIITDSGIMIPTQQTIFLNSAAKWGRVNDQVKELFNKKKISTDRPEHFIYGLICENMMDASNHNNFKDLCLQTPSSEANKILRKNVSHLATESKLSAVKEIFAKLMTDKEVSKPEMEIYTKFGGPKLTPNSK